MHWDDYTDNEWSGSQEEWDVVILIKQSKWLVLPARPYSKVIMKLKVLDTLG